RGPGHECRDHEHLALGEVERAGGVVDDHEAEGDQRVDTTGGEPAHDDVREGGPGHARAPSAPAGPRGPVLASLATGTYAHGRNTALARARLSRQPRARRVCRISLEPWRTGK